MLAYLTAGRGFNLLSFPLSCFFTLDSSFFFVFLSCGFSYTLIAGGTFSFMLYDNFYATSLGLAYSTIFLPYGGSLLTMAAKCFTGVLWSGGNSDELFFGLPGGFLAGWEDLAGIYLFFGVSLAFSTFLSNYVISSFFFAYSSLAFNLASLFFSTIVGVFASTGFTWTGVDIFFIDFAVSFFASAPLLMETSFYMISYFDSYFLISGFMPPFFALLSSLGTTFGWIFGALSFKGILGLLFSGSYDLDYLGFLSDLGGTTLAVFLSDFKFEADLDFLSVSGSGFFINWLNS